MKWLLRFSIVVTVALALGAVALVGWSLWEGTASSQAVAQPLGEGDQEIAWLYAATNAAAWERFVTAVRRVQDDCPDLGLLVDDTDAFPRQTTAVPELALSVRGSKSWLRFRWYKLTSDLKTGDWVHALVDKQRAPLAIIGGSSSDLAIDLAQTLQERSRDVGASPLLLFTMATSDEVRAPDGRLVPLNSLYPGRTYRFCFTNRQMAAAVTSFLWSQDDLRPDGDPVYLAYWQDDPYSENLIDRFVEALRLTAVRSAAQDWAWLAGAATACGGPLDLTLSHRGAFRLTTVDPPERIPYSIGTFHRPNRWESDAAKDLMEHFAQNPVQRPLLVLPATWQPARRFLHGLMRNSPAYSRRFVVATGDAIPFNTVYRDRNLAWPIQDLPFSLVFFCHRNPVDARAGFQPENGAQPAQPNAGSPATGTEDLLLYVDIVQALVQAAYTGGTMTVNADELGGRLSDARLQDGGRVCYEASCQLLFDADGNRRSGTGEHVVSLRPVVEERRWLPQATITVWAWQGRGGGGGSWHLSRPPLRVEYDEESGTRE